MSCSQIHTAMFSAVHAVLLRSLPFPQPGRLMFVSETVQREGVERRPASYPDFADWRERSRGLDAMAIVDPHYLLSDIVLAVWAARGILALGLGPRWIQPLAAAVLLLQPVWQGRFAQMDRRENLVGYDYALNALRSTPPRAAFSHSASEGNLIKIPSFQLNQLQKA